METYFQEVENSAKRSSSRRSSESDDSERLVIVDVSEDPEGSQGRRSAKGSTGRRKHSFEEYKKICIKDFILKKLTYYKLKRLMTLYKKGISEKNRIHRRRCLNSWKTAKAMSKILMMFHLMFEEIKENITLNGIYYQQMSDLISIYLDFEIKASEVSAESASTLSSRVTFIMEKFLDHQYRFTLDTLLKSKNIGNKFQEISTLIISRVVRGLPSTKYSEQLFIRSMLVFKLWIQITKDAEERTKILKLASHLAKPPKELLKEPSKLAKEILPCNFRKCYIDITTYIIGTPWSLSKKIKAFLEHTRIVETLHEKESISKSSIDHHHTEEQKNSEMADIKALKEIQSGLHKIILLEKKNKKIIRTFKNNHYKYAPIEELIERAPHSLEHLKLSKKDASTQTVSEQIEEFSFSHTKVIHECINELFKRMVEHTNIEQGQHQEREDLELHHGKVLTGISITDLPNNAQNAEFPQESVPKEVSNLLHYDSTSPDRIKNIMSVSDPNENIQNNGVAVMEVDRKGKTNNMEDEIVPTISVRPAASISSCFDNVSCKAIADWHTPEIHSQSRVSSYNPFLPPYGMQMTAGHMNKRPTETNQTDAELPPITSTLPLPQNASSNINYEQSNPYVDLVRSTGCLPPSRNYHHPESNLTIGSPNTLLNRRAILRSSHVNDSTPGCREDNLLVRDTTIKYYPPLSKNNLNLGPFNHQAQGMNSVGCAKDRNYPRQQPYPMLFNQHNIRPHYSQANGTFSFYDDDTIANSGPRIMGCEHPNVANPNSIVANGVQTQYPQSFNLPSGNNDESTSRPNQTRRRGRGGRNTSAVQRSYKKQSPEKPQTNITANSNPNCNNPNLQSWHNIPMQEHYNSFRTLDCNIPNSNSQIMLRPPFPTPNIIQNDPKLPYTRLPPYSSIRRKNNWFDPALLTTDSPSNNLPLNTTPNCFPATNAPITMSVTRPQPVINNSCSLPIVNTASSSPHTNVLLRGPVTSATTSRSVPQTSEANSEVMKSDNYNRIYGKDATFYPSELYSKVCNNALRKAICMLTRKNDFGFLEYDFKEMPLPLKAFKDALSCFEQMYSSSYTADTIDEIIALLSQANENFINEKNVYPPQLLKVNSNDINKGKFNIAQEQRKRHEGTLSNDKLAFVYQVKIRNFYSESNEVSQDDFVIKSDLQTRCYCLQCCVNKLVLDVNYTILKHFRHYRVSYSSIRTNENEKSQPLKNDGISKRSLENSVKERDSPLPLKKRITSTPTNEARLTKDSEVSYPSTPMISIAELELLKEISTNMKEHKTDSVNGITGSTSGTIPNSMVESKSSEISKNISSNAEFLMLGRKESTIMSANNIGNLSQVRTGHNLSNSELIQSPIVTEPRKLQVKSASKKAVGRPRKNAKKEA